MRRTCSATIIPSVVFITHRALHGNFFDRIYIFSFALARTSFYNFAAPLNIMQASEPLLRETQDWHNVYWTDYLWSILFLLWTVTYGAIELLYGLLRLASLVLQHLIISAVRFVIGSGFMPND